MAPARCVLKVRGLDCPAEVPLLRAALERTPGVRNLAFDPPAGTVAVEFDPAAVGPSGLIARIARDAGMAAEVLDEGAVPDRPRRWKTWRPVVASGVLLGLGMLLGRLGRPSWPLFAAAIVAGGVVLGPKAARALRRGRLDIHVLMSMAILGALALGQWDEAATVAFLFGLSEALEALSLDHARRAVRALLDIAPETAELIREGCCPHVVPAREVRPGQRVRVRAGDRVSVDGLVLVGRTSVDQSSITGESVPVPKGPGDPVYAGTVNVEGSIEVEATCALGDAVVSRVAERVRLAQAGRTPTERAVDRFAGWYTPIVAALALAVVLVPPLANLATGSMPGWSTWTHRGLVILVIACPCALVIGTPVAVVSALAAAARRGILIKGGQSLEAVAGLKVLAFDKTGTLTLGTPEVVEVVSNLPGEDAEVLRIGAALGDLGGHVLGRAIARHARGLRLEVPVASGYRAVPGLGASATVDSSAYHMGSHRYLDEAGLCPPEFHARIAGVEGSVGTSVALSAPGGPLGWIRLADRPRPEALAALDDLRALGIDPIMLTGDNGPTSLAVATELGILDQRSGLLPEDKAAIVADLDRRRGPAGMVGDGVNDAPALAAARVSFAMGGIGSGVALEAADVVLLADDLAGLPWLVRHSRRTLGRIRQNIAFAVGAKLIVLALAVAGMANLWLAIGADLGVSLVVVANALRLLRPSR